MLAGGDLQIHCFVAPDLYVLQRRSIISEEGQEADFSFPHIFFCYYFKIISLFLFQG